MEFKTAPAAGDMLEVNLTVFDRGVVNAKGRNVGARLPLARIVRPAMSVFAEQVKQVLIWAELREERRSEILVQIDNVHCFWNSVIPIMSDRLRHTRELLDAAVQMAMFVEMRFKHELACWRPADFSAQVQPMISTPGHGSLPSGHCTQSYVILTVLKSLLRSGSAVDAHVSIDRQLEKLAQRISTNRVVAGVHFPVDNIAGRMLGQALGEYFVYLCYKATDKSKDRVKPGWNFAEFDGGKIDDPAIQFDPYRQILTSYKTQERPAFYNYADPIQMARSMDADRARAIDVESVSAMGQVHHSANGTSQAPMLQELYAKAVAECDASGISFSD